MPDTSQTVVTFRPISAREDGGDLPFLRRLYASTRQEEMALSGWPQPQIDAFLLQQFEAQHAHYMEHFVGADFDLILGEDGEAIGRLYLEERDDEFRVIDIALLPEQRGKGLGGQIMRDVLDRAAASGKSVRIHVEKNNPAMRLYHRLGFERIEEQGVYDLMEAKPNPVTASA